MVLRIVSVILEWNRFWRGVLSDSIRKLLHKLPCLYIEGSKLWNLDNYMEVHISPVVGVSPEGWNTAATKPQCLSILDSGWNCDLHLSAIYYRDLDLAAEGGLHEGDRYLKMQVPVLSDEVLVLLHIDDNYQVTGRTTVSACIALSSCNQLGSIIGAYRNRNSELLLLSHYASSMTGGAWVLYCMSRTVAGRTGSYSLEEATTVCDLAVATTGRTGP